MKNIFPKLRNRGFTLVEIIVVIGIVSIMVSMGIISMRSSKDDASLRAAQDEVASVIKLAQSYALQGKNSQGNCGYGFDFTNNNTYQIFSYSVANCANVAGVINRSNSEVNNLKNGIILISPAPTVNASSIFFGFPHGKVFFRSGLDKTFTLRSPSGAIKTIRVDGMGQITKN